LQNHSYKNGEFGPVARKSSSLSRKKKGDKGKGEVHQPLVKKDEQGESTVNDIRGEDEEDESDLRTTETATQYESEAVQSAVAFLAAMEQPEEEEVEQWMKDDPPVRSMEQFESQAFIPVGETPDIMRKYPKYASKKAVLTKIDQ